MKPLSLGIVFPRLLLLLLLPLGSITVVLAQGSHLNSSSLPGRLGQMPSCADSSFENALNGSSCAASSQSELLQCICPNKEVQARFQEYLFQSCSIKDILTAINDINSSCGVPGHDKSKTFFDVSIAFAVVASLCVLLRVVLKMSYMRTDIGLDDYMLIISFLGGIAYCVINTTGLSNHGFGKDMWTLPFDNVTKIFVYLYVSAALYIIEIATLKLSILAFYLRIFPTAMVQWLLWGTFAFVSAYSTAYFFFSLFQCHPVSYFWNEWDGEHSGKCVGDIRVILSHAGINIVVDVWMLLIPLSQLARLNMDWKKKFGVGLMFFVGTFVTIVSVARLISLAKSSDSPNVTYNEWYQYLWPTIEVYTGIICACMPAMRITLVKLTRYIWRSTVSAGSAWKSSVSQKRNAEDFNNSSSLRQQQQQEQEQEQRQQIQPHPSPAGSRQDDDDDKKGVIMLSRTFDAEVHREQDLDEARLIPLQDMDFQRGRMRVTGT